MIARTQEQFPEKGHDCQLQQGRAVSSRGGVGHYLPRPHLSSRARLDCLDQDPTPPVAGIDPIPHPVFS